MRRFLPENHLKKKPHHPSSLWHLGKEMVKGRKITVSKKLNWFDKVEDIWDYESGWTGGRMDAALASYVWMLLFMVTKLLFSHLDICAGRGLLDFVVKCTTSFCLQHRAPLHGLCHWVAGELRIYSIITFQLEAEFKPHMIFVSK